MDLASIATDADNEWIDHQVASRLFGAVPHKIGRYTILATLGSGGMGLVYRAHDEQLDRSVAVKLLNADWSTPEGAVRLHREARAMARLSHPNVVQIYEVGQHHERVFLAMEYVEGETLEAWLARKPTPPEIHALFMSIGLGVAAAHGVGIIHRDLKPTNILVDVTGRPRVADFGLASTVVAVDIEDTSTLRGVGRAHGTQTQISRFAGTPQYMAPEQHAGTSATAHSDQFSFALMLWEALCGDLPFRQASTSDQEERAWVLQPPRRGTGLSARIRRALTRALEVDPSRRWPDMHSLLAALAPRPLSRRFAWGLLAAGLLAAWPFGPYLRQADPAPTNELCGSGLTGIGGYKSANTRRWREALAARPHSPHIDRYLGHMLETWSSDADAICAGTSSGDAAKERRERLRRAACVRGRADLLDLLLSDASAAKLQPTSGGSSQELRPKISAGRAGSLQIECPDARHERGREWLGPRSTREGAISRSIAHASVLVDIGQPNQALEVLDASVPHLAMTDLSAMWHLVHAEALRGVGASAAEVLWTLRIAEQVAVAGSDPSAAFEAQIEQVRVDVEDWRQRAEYAQSQPPVEMDGLSEVILSRAEESLREQADPRAEDRVRLVFVRSALAAALRRPLMAAELRRRALTEARLLQASLLLSLLLSDEAGHSDPTVAAQYDSEAIRLAPRDDAVLGYLNFVAAGRARERDDLAGSVRHYIDAELHYASAFGPTAPVLAKVAYAHSQALYMAGEALNALPEADKAVGHARRLHDELMLPLALYLRSAIHLRIGGSAEAVADARGALRAHRGAAYASLVAKDYFMWRSMLRTGIVESQVEAGQLADALALAGELEVELRAEPHLGIAGQSDELLLARARALRRQGKDADALRLLDRVSAPGVLEHDRFKRAEALALRAELLGPSAPEATRLATQAAELFAQLGTDGAARICAMKGFYHPADQNPRCASLPE